MRADNLSVLQHVMPKIDAILMSANSREQNLKQLALPLERSLSKPTEPRRNIYVRFRRQSVDIRNMQVLQGGLFQKRVKNSWKLFSRFFKVVLSQKVCLHETCHQFFINSRRKSLQCWHCSSMHLLLKVVRNRTSSPFNASPMMG